MRENRPSGLMRGGKQTVIGSRASQSVVSRLLYTKGVSAWTLLSWGLSHSESLALFIGFLALAFQIFLPSVKCQELVRP
jgi:hypothetical protein